MDVRGKLVELLWEYDQMRMMRMSIEECADRLIPKGLTVRKCENDTKCSDLAICLDENAKEKTERIVDLMTSFYGVDPGYYGVEAYPLASHLIANGVTVREWISVSSDELNNYIGMPVCILRKTDGCSWWAIIRGIKGDKVSTDYGGYFMLSDYGQTWIVKYLPMPQLPKGE